MHGYSTDRLETMASPEGGPDRPDRPEGSGSQGRDEYPLLFKPGAYPSRPSLLARILAFFRETADEPEPRPAERVTLSRAAARPQPLPPAEVEAAIVEEAAEEQPAAETPVEEPPVEEEAAEEQPAAATPVEERPVERQEPDDGPGDPEARATAHPVHRATLQMLPGRLVPAGRGAVGQEIRFLRPANPEASVTLGREEGEPPEHVSIDHPTLEPRHATMRYRRGHWWIASLSDDNPVQLNGRALEVEGGARHLKDGDRVRLGEVELHFRMP